MMIYNEKNDDVWYFDDYIYVDLCDIYVYLWWIRGDLWLIYDDL